MAQYEMDVPAPNLWKLIFFDTLFKLFFWVCSIHPQMGSENTVSQNLLVLIHPQIPSQPPSRPAAQPPSRPALSQLGPKATCGSSFNASRPGWLVLRSVMACWVAAMLPQGQSNLTRFHNPMEFMYVYVTSCPQKIMQSCIIYIYIYIYIIYIYIQYSPHLSMCVCVSMIFLPQILIIKW